MHRIYRTPVADVYPHYLTKVLSKGRSEAELTEAICWLTQTTKSELASYLEERTSFREFFAATELNPNAVKITGSICGVKIAEIQDPLMKKIRYLDKVVDELSKGKPLEKIFRSEVM